MCWKSFLRLSLGANFGGVICLDLLSLCLPLVWVRLLGWYGYDFFLFHLQMYGTSGILALLWSGLASSQFDLAQYVLDVFRVPL